MVLINSQCFFHNKNNTLFHNIKCIVNGLFLPLIHHQNVICGVAFSPMALGRMPNTSQTVDLG